MLESLPSNVRSTLLEYEIVKRYLNGMLGKEKFLEWLKEHAQELMSKGIPKGYINNLYRADAENEFHRKAAYSKFARFCRKIGLDIATPEDKIIWIKSSSPNQFLDIVSIGNSLLLGLFKFSRWRRDSKADKSKVAFGLAGDFVEVDPPDDAHIHFKEFFHRMKRRITTATKDRWAVKLYFAIVFAHMFPDGNGRTSRNAYFILRSNSGLPDEEKALKRSAIIQGASERANITSIIYLVRQEGIRIPMDGNEAAKYRADEVNAEAYSGDTCILKYLACKRVLQKRGQWNIEMKEIVYGKWDRAMRAEFEEEYQKIRVLWYWTAISLADKYYKYFQQELDKAIL